MKEVQSCSAHAAPSSGSDCQPKVMSCSHVCSQDYLQAHDTNFIVISKLMSPLKASTPDLEVFIWVKYQREIQYRDNLSISIFFFFFQGGRGNILGWF